MKVQTFTIYCFFHLALPVKCYYRKDSYFGNIKSKMTIKMEKTQKNKTNYFLRHRIIFNLI